MKLQNFEPKIIAFLCNWCTYGAADLAGVSRLSYPPNIRVIRVMCSSPYRRITSCGRFKAVRTGSWWAGDILAIAITCMVIT